MDSISQPAVTYSRSVTLTITHDCPWRCQYCGFRSSNQGLLTDYGIEETLNTGKRYGVTEALLISGEHPYTLPHIREQLRIRGYRDFFDFVCSVAERCIEAGILPHGNYGALNEHQLHQLRPFHVSMGLMLENVEDHSDIAPEKRSFSRLRTINTAGKLQIPFTSGILIGLGESHDSRLKSLEALAQSHLRHGHLQEILIQNFIANQYSPLDVHFEKAHAPTLDDYQTLISFWKEICPSVPIQIPPNLNPYWEELLPLIDDLGGISPNKDEVNPGTPWAELETYDSACAKKNVQLRHRMPVYEKYQNEDWVEEHLLDRLSINKTKFSATESVAT